MTYELYVFDAEQVADLDAAREAHDAMPYFERSQPVSESGARKWRTVRALQAASRDLTLIEAEKPRRSEQEMRYAQLANLDTAHALCLNVFDDAVEIVLEIPEKFVDAESVVKATFTCLLRLEMEGYARVYDAQLDRLLDPGNDQDLVLRAYAASPGMVERATPPAGTSQEQSNSASVAAASGQASTQSATPQGPHADGNRKPWWKFW